MSATKNEPSEEPFPEIKGRDIFQPKPDTYRYRYVTKWSNKMKAWVDKSFKINQGPPVKEYGTPDEVYDGWARYCWRVYWDNNDKKVVIPISKFFTEQGVRYPQLKEYNGTIVYCGKIPGPGFLKGPEKPDSLNW